MCDTQAVRWLPRVVVATRKGVGRVPRVPVCTRTCVTAAALAPTFVLTTLPAGCYAWAIRHFGGKHATCAAGTIHASCMGHIRSFGASGYSLRVATEAEEASSASVRSGGGGAPSASPNPSPTSTATTAQARQRQRQRQRQRPRDDDPPPQLVSGNSGDSLPSASPATSPVPDCAGDEGDAVEEAVEEEAEVDVEEEEEEEEARPCTPREQQSGSGGRSKATAAPRVPQGDEEDASSASVTPPSVAGLPAPSPDVPPASPQCSPGAPPPLSARSAGGAAGSGRGAGASSLHASMPQSQQSSPQQQPKKDENTPDETRQLLRAKVLLRDDTPITLETCVCGCTSGVRRALPPWVKVHRCSDGVELTMLIVCRGECVCV